MYAKTILAALFEEEHYDLLVSFLREKGISYGVRDGDMYEIEGQFFWPGLDKRLKEAHENRAAGKVHRLEPTDSADGFWEQVRKWED